MSFDVFLAVLAAAFMHAAWNGLIKTGTDRFMSISLMSFGMSVIALFCLPFVAVPVGLTWVWIVLSAILHTGYKVFLVRAYETGDMAQVYPLARGAAPLITAVVAGVLLGEHLTAPMTTGIVVLCSGIWLMSMRGGHARQPLAGAPVWYALITSAFIAGYTLADGIGARGAASAASYAAWMFLIDGAWMMVFCLSVRGVSVTRAMAARWKAGLGTGVLSFSAYWIAIWAMTKAPIAAVAALRESSILFALLISTVFLKERLTVWRLAAATLIIAGIIALRVG